MFLLSLRERDLGGYDYWSLLIHLTDLTQSLKGVEQNPKKHNTSLPSTSRHDATTFEKNPLVFWGTS